MTDNISEHFPIAEQAELLAILSRASATRAEVQRMAALSRKALDRLTALESALAEAQRERDEEKRKREEAHDWIARRGYRRCDIAACNCGLWHGGHAEARLDEVGNELAEAGAELLNGVTILAAVKAQIARAESAESALSAKEEELRGCREALIGLAFSQSLADGRWCWCDNPQGGIHEPGCRAARAALSAAQQKEQKA